MAPSILRPSTAPSTAPAPRCKRRTAVSLPPVLIRLEDNPSLLLLPEYELLVSAPPAARARTRRPAPASRPPHAPRARSTQSSWITRMEAVQVELRKEKAAAAATAAAESGSALREVQAPAAVAMALASQKAAAKRRKSCLPAPRSGGRGGGLTSASCENVPPQPKKHNYLRRKSGLPKWARPAEPEPEPAAESEPAPPQPPSAPASAPASPLAAPGTPKLPTTPAANEEMFELSRRHSLGGSAVISGSPFMTAPTPRAVADDEIDELRRAAEKRDREARALEEETRHVEALARKVREAGRESASLHEQIRQMHALSARQQPRST